MKIYTESEMLKVFISFFFFLFFQGQWLNDLFNGQGTMKHSSGMIYEGIWVNGHPANMAQKLVITITPEDILQGVFFNVEVQCQTEDGTPVSTGKNKKT